jgi:hypothetical protein
MIERRLRPSDGPGHLITTKRFRKFPLNGRYFLRTSLCLFQGSVTAANKRIFRNAGTWLGGAMQSITAGNSGRERSIYSINGITLNNQAFSSISFQPSTINTVSDFRVDNSNRSSANSDRPSGAGRQHCHALRPRKSFNGEVFAFLRQQ